MDFGKIHNCAAVDAGKIVLEELFLNLTDGRAQPVYFGLNNETLLRNRFHTADEPDMAWACDDILPMRGLSQNTHDSCINMRQHVPISQAF